MCREAGKKNLNININAVISTLAGMAIQLFAKGLGFTHKALFAWTTAGFQKTAYVVQPFCDTVWGNISSIRGLRVAEAHETVFRSGSPLPGSDIVNGIARALSVEVYDAILFLCYSILESVIKIVCNRLLYAMRNKWPKLDKFRFPQKTSTSYVCSYSEEYYQGSEHRFTWPS